MRGVRHAFVRPAMATLLMLATLMTLLMLMTAASCAAQPHGSMSLRIPIPAQVSRHAAARAAGDAAAPAPVLMLEDLEVGDGEGLKLQILGPADPKTGKPGPVLAVASTVGSPQATPRPPLQRMTLAIPLNDRAVAYLQGKKEARLVLQVANSPGRPAPKFKRAYFHELPGE
jgi:hypothetical protein